PTDQSWRVEFQLHDWVVPDSTATRLFALNGVGLEIFIYPDGRLAIIDRRDELPGGSPCLLSLSNRANVLLRVQRNYPERVFSCELWNSDGTGYDYKLQKILESRNWEFDGGKLGGSTGSLGFLRVFTSLTPLRSQPPNSAEPGNWTELFLEENGLDSSGNQHDLSGNLVFTATPAQLPVAIISTPGNLFWFD